MVTGLDAIGFSELQRLGVPLEGEVLERIRIASLGLDIEISERTISDAEFGGTILVIHALISNVSLRRIRLDQCRVDPPWHDPDFCLLESPWRKVPREYMYSSPRDPSLSFERKAVLNHRFGREGWLNPGDSIHGMILGEGSEAIPHHYQDRQGVDVQLMIWDGRGTLYLKKTCVMLHRSKRLMRQMEAIKRVNSRNQRKRIQFFHKVAA